jgi:hypothetical protein
LAALPVNKRNMRTPGTLPNLAIHLQLCYSPRFVGSLPAHCRAHQQLSNLMSTSV